MHATPVVTDTCSLGCIIHVMFSGVFPCQEPFLRFMPEEFLEKWTVLFDYAFNNGGMFKCVRSTLLTIGCFYMLSNLLADACSYAMIHNPHCVLFPFPLSVILPNSCSHSHSMCQWRDDYCSSSSPDLARDRLMTQYNRANPLTTDTLSFNIFIYHVYVINSHSGMFIKITKLSFQIYVEVFVFFR